ncbi:MAG: M23 family metallopeptidase [bacterium]|nr:M23 family metallopeptidase [bacterium]
MIIRSRAMLFTVLISTATIAGAFLFLRNNRILDQEPPIVAEEILWQGAVPQPSPTPVPLPLPTLLPGSLAPSQTVKLFSAAALSGAHPVYDFSMYIPATWETESVRTIEALNFYEIMQQNKTNTESSRIFVRYFRANSFLTLSSVSVLSRKNIIVAGRPAVDYIIEKKPGYPNFPKQPTWRNMRHRVVDVRVSDSNPSAFYVFAKSPELSDEVFEAMLDTLVVAPKDLLFYPLDGAKWLSGESFSGAVTKKPFGAFITPENSPVTPEKFTGYHTGVDLEISETISATASISVLAIADGVVVRSGKAQGYGGVVAVRHNIHSAGAGQVGDDSYLAVYGHLNPKTLIKLGTHVKAGQAIGVLGKGFTIETDGERRHLHFGLYTGQEVNIAGYVLQESELQNWVDPVKFFAERMP